MALSSMSVSAMVTVKAHDSSRLLIQERHRLSRGKVPRSVCKARSAMGVSMQENMCRFARFRAVHLKVRHAIKLIRMAH